MDTACPEVFIGSVIKYKPKEIPWDLEKLKSCIIPAQCKEYCEELKWRRFERYHPWPREFEMGENISPHAGEEHGCRWHHYSSDERCMHFTATFNEGTLNVPMLISCQTNYSNITGFVLLIANISCLIDSQRVILPAAFHHCCDMLSTWALPTAWVPAPTEDAQPPPDCEARNGSLQPFRTEDFVFEEKLKWTW